MAAPWICIAATASVAEPLRARAGEIAFIPCDEDDGIASPCLGGHDRIDGVEQEGIAGRDKRLDLRKIARVGGGSAATVHVMALIRADPDIVGYGVVRKVGSQLAEVDNIRHAGGIRLNVLVADKR